MRAVLDPNVFVSALLSRTGTPAQILRRWIGGDFELVVSLRLLNELEHTLDYPKIADRLEGDEPAEFVQRLRDHAVVAADPDSVPERAPDPADDYLIALAEAERAVLVTGDQHLLGLADEFPILATRVFLETLETQR